MFTSRRAAIVVLLACLGAGAALARLRHDAGSTDAHLAMQRVIVSGADPIGLSRAIEGVGGVPGRRLRSVGAQVARVPAPALERLAAHPAVTSIRSDRPIAGAMLRAAPAVGAQWIREQLGYDGSGVGVAIIDSGVADWHDDLPTAGITHFVDFVTDLPLPHDDYGHGTHVAGTIAGSGFDSGGARRGLAPGARLVILKVLDAAGDGHISNVIAAIDYAIEHRARFNIRVINLSVASGVYESYLTDPLTVAVRRAVEAGIVVVTSAGNLGRNARGRPQFGGVTSPGNAPWVITVGASNHHGTPARADDTVAPFSSRGPTHIDRALKPDLLAPGVAIESLAAAGSTLFDLHPEARIRGTIDTAHAPYMSLSGTSMAAPLVTGTVALMLQANPGLTPNLVKAILHYTAERRPRTDLTVQGAGLLNARGAVQLAVTLARGEPGPADPSRWARHIIWGNSRMSGGVITPDASAWRRDVTWGAAAAPDGSPIFWGRTADADVPWGFLGTHDDLPAPYAADDPAWATFDLSGLAIASSASLARPQHGSLPAALLDRRWLPLMTPR